MLTLPVHHDWIQVFMESVLFIYIFFWVLVCPCQLFVRLWYRVSDVLDLSLVSKRFGFWPHIIHVIVLTFKEIKHLSDYRTVGLSDRRTIGLSDCRIIGRTPYLLGRIPVEGVLHKRILITFGNIIRNINSVERDIAFRQLHCRVPDK